MKAITIHQPWATLLVTGEKLYETRSWHTAHRGQLLVHAAKKFTEDMRLMIGMDPFYQSLSRHGITKPDQLPKGKIVGMVTLEACIPTEELELDIARTNEQKYGDFRPGRWAWKVSRPEEAVAFAGHEAWLLSSRSRSRRKAYAAGIRESLCVAGQPAGRRRAALSLPCLEERAQRESDRRRRRHRADCSVDAGQRQPIRERWPHPKVAGELNRSNHLRHGEILRRIVGFLPPIQLRLYTVDRRSDTVFPEIRSSGVIDESSRPSQHVPQDRQIRCEWRKGNQAR